MKQRLLFSILVMLLVCLSVAAVEPAYQTIKIKEIFSRLLVRDEADRVYSGQIKSETGLAEFKKTYGIDIGKQAIDFKKQMLIFGVTDNIETQAFQFLRQERITSYVLDYAGGRVKYKLQKPEKGKKHVYLQVFILDRIDGIPHVAVKNLVRNGLSEMYGKEDSNNIQEEKRGQAL